MDTMHSRAKACEPADARTEVLRVRRVERSLARPCHVLVTGGRGHHFGDGRVERTEFATLTSRDARSLGSAHFVVLPSLTTLVTVGALLLQVRSADAQTLRGRVHDLVSGEGVTGVEVMLWRGQSALAAVRTDSTGLFVMGTSDTGTFRVLSRRVGYYGGGIDGLRMMTRDTFELIIRMERIAQVIDVLKVEGKKAGLDFTQGFEERRKRGLGTFLGPEDIEKMGFHRAPDLLWGKPGWEVRVIPTPSGIQIRRIFSSRASGLSQCEPALYVDGFEVDGEQLTLNYSSADMEAVEMYQASQVPVRFQKQTSLCGAIFFWTRSSAGKRDR